MSATKKAPVTGAARFEQAPVQPPRKSALESLAAGIALLGLIAGVPALLLLLGGAPPIPTSLPDAGSLTGQIGAEQVIAVLVGIVWLAWLHFLLCTLVEIVAAVRGGALAPRVPLGGASQRLARALVAAILLSTGIAGQAAALAAPPTQGVVASQSVISSAVATDVASVQSTAVAAGAEVHEAGEEDLWGNKVYTVQPPEGRHHDSLWDIAERHLGDGRRYQEIFQLNADREQPDGRSLQLARLIQPGWHLVMPADAVGVPVWEKPATPAPAPAQQGSPSADGASAADAGADLADDAEGGAGGGSEKGGVLGAVTDGRSLAGAALLAVGLLSALRRSRRRRAAALAMAPADAVETEVWLRVGAAEDRAERLTWALGGLTGLCADMRMPVPEAYAATIDGDAVELYLAPAAPDAPAPWSAVDEGRRWRLDRASAPRRVAVGELPYPALVSVGRDMDGRDVLVNLAAAAGSVAVTGSPALAGQVVRALAAELATSAWSADARVIGVGLAPELDTLGSERLARVPSVDEALTLLSSRGPGDGVVSGRRGTDGGVDVVVLGSDADPAGADRLRTLAASAGGSVAVVGAGALSGARWTFLVDDAGSLHVDALALTVTSSRIDDRTLHALAGLFAAGSDSSPEPAGPAGRVEIPAPPRPTDDGAWATAPSRVGLLGPVLVRAPGPIDSSRVDLAAELVAVLAVHSSGVHPNVLGGAVWPRGVTTEVRDATIARVRDWLGQDEQGTYRLHQDRLGRLSLSPDVVTDWHVFCSLAASSRIATGPSQERDLLARALRLVRGALAADSPPGRYAWLARTGLEITVPAVIADAAHRLVELLYTDDPGGAAEAARCGLRADPSAQQLWRDLLWSEYSQWGPDGARSAVEELVHVLADLGVDVEPETTAVIEELLPNNPLPTAASV